MDGRARQRSKTQAAAFREDKGARTSASVVPEIAISPATVVRQRVSAWRIGLITTLTVIVGGFAWFTEGPQLSSFDPSRIAASSGHWAEPLAPNVRQEIEHDLRLAVLALDIREGQDHLSRLWDDTRALAARVATLASGMEGMNADEIARIEERLLRAVSAASGSAIDVSSIVERDLAMMRRLDRIEAQLLDVHTAKAASAEPRPLGPPDITGALPDADPKPAVTVRLASAKRIGAPRPMKGWMVHAVGDDFALVEGNGQHYEVRAGELLPEAGTVKEIKKRGESWIVVTSKGIITEPK